MTSRATLVLPDREIGPGHPVLVIAEAGVNHDGRIDRAIALIEAAAATGADAVKFQAFRADRLVAPGTPKAAYQEAGDDAPDQVEMLRRLELSTDDLRRLAEEARSRGILFLASPFDETSLDDLVEIGVPAIKLGSGEITNHPLLAACARTGLPLILSTGMSRIDEVAEAKEVFDRAGGKAIALLHCVSSYPAPSDQIDLRSIETLRRAFEVPVGYSDHTEGEVCSLAAVALGASIVEKHLTLDRTMPGPDHAASAEPEELAHLIEGIREIEAALGDGRKQPRPCETEIRRLARRSVAADRALPAGRPIPRDALAVLRPGTGIPPAEIDRVVGRVPRRDLDAGTILEWEMFG